MKFKIKELALGETKTLIKFAWFPTKIENCIIWLEKYKAIYKVFEFSKCPRLGRKEDNYNNWLLINKKLLNNYGKRICTKRTSDSTQGVGI